MRAKLILLFVVAAVISLVVTGLEVLFFLFTPSLAPVVALAAFNLLLIWTVVGVLWTAMGLLFAPQPAPKDSARAWLGRAVTTLGRALLRLVLVAASAVLILLVSWLVGATSSDWSIKLIQAAAWPAVVALALLVVVGTQSGIQVFKSISARLQKVSAFGVDLELTAEVAKQVQANVKISFDEYRERINLEFDRQVREHRIDDLLAVIVDQSIGETYQAGLPADWKISPPSKYRCTVHVQDVLLHGALYQLLDYYPTGPGRGRAFSVRYGIIGKTWRLGKDQWEGNVFTRADQLVQGWAMTWQEAREAEQKGVTSFICVLLKDKQDLPVGILYFDSTDKDAFGPENQMKKLADVAREHCRNRLLTESIIELGGEMRKVGPALTFFK